MPRKDGTGPEGKGSKTGRGQGTCNPDSKNSGSAIRKGRGAGQGAGRGAGSGGGKGRGKGGRK